MPSLASRRSHSYTVWRATPLRRAMELRGAGRRIGPGPNTTPRGHGHGLSGPHGRCRARRTRNWIGQQAGWRLPFVVLSCLGLAGVAAVALLVPTTKPSQSHAAAGTGPNARRYWMLVTATVLAAAGTFTACTYVSAFLTKVSGLPDLSRLRRSRHEPPPRPMRRLHRRRPCDDARDQRPSWRSHRRPQAGAAGVGQSQPRRRLRPGAAPARNPAAAGDRETHGHRRGCRLLQGVRVGHSAREVDAACFDVGGADRAGEPGD
jgi:hypothetical protein